MSAERKSTPRPTEHQAELAAKVATGPGTKAALRRLGEEVLQTYFSTNYTKKPAEDFPPHEWRA